MVWFLDPVVRPIKLRNIGPEFRIRNRISRASRVMIGSEMTIDDQQLRTGPGNGPPQQFNIPHGQQAIRITPGGLLLFNAYIAETKNN